MTVAAYPYALLVPAYQEPDKALVRFRILRDGAVTAGEKTVRIYKSWAEVGKLDLVFKAEDGEFSAWENLDISVLESNPQWVVTGADETEPRTSRADYLALSEPGTYTFNITSPVDKPEGLGYLAGEFPNGVTSRLDIPVSATIRVFHTNAQGQAGKVAEVVSASDGTWIVDNLDPTKQFDVICSLAGFNDLILSKVSPTPY